MHYCITALLHYCIIVLLYYFIAALLYYCITVLLYYCITELPYPRSTPLLVGGLRLHTPHPHWWLRRTGHGFGVCCYYKSTYNQDPGARSTEVSTCLFSADRGPGGAWRGSGTLKTGGPGARSQPGTFLRAFGGLSGEPQKGSLSADGPNMAGAKLSQDGPKLCYLHTHSRVNHD